MPLFYQQKPTSIKRSQIDDITESHVKGDYYTGQKYRNFCHEVYNLIPHGYIGTEVTRSKKSPILFASYYHAVFHYFCVYYFLSQNFKALGSQWVLSFTGQEQPGACVIIYMHILYKINSPLGPCFICLGRLVIYFVGNDKHPFCRKALPSRFFMPIYHSCHKVATMNK